MYVSLSVSDAWFHLPVLVFRLFCYLPGDGLSVKFVLQPTIASPLLNSRIDYFVQVRCISKSTSKVLADIQCLQHWNFRAVSHSTIQHQRDGTYSCVRHKSCTRVDLLGGSFANHEAIVANSVTGTSDTTLKAGPSQRGALGKKIGWRAESLQAKCPIVRE